ncbi:MAG: hypothetical protein EB075_04020, partial [Bacteroidetes bacterium]|nr:hypothetical protein [Bacteroidota bacterium]
MAIRFSNNAQTTLASGITASATSITVANGSVFPALTPGDHTYVTLEDLSGNLEIVKVTAISSNTLTVTRGQDGTTARAFSQGDFAQLRVTAALLNDLADESGYTLWADIDNVPSPVITLSGDASGSATMTELGDTTLSVTVANDSHTHDGRYYTESEIDTRMNYTLYSPQSAIGGDLDSLSHYGFYTWASPAPTNAPGSYGFMLYGSDTNQDQQLAQTYGGTTSSVSLYGRRKTNGTWQSWTQYFSDHYHPNADKWTTARTLTLSGDVSGSVSWDGSANATLTTTVANDSHTHSNYVLKAGDTLTGRLVFAESGYSISDDLHVWKRTYSVWLNNPKELLYHDGNSLPNGGAYRFHAHIPGTGTDQSATAVYWNQNGTWKVNVTYQSGVNSNHPEFIIGSNGKPHISIDHSTTYTIEILAERLELGEGTGTDNKSGFGADAYMSEVQGALRHNPNGGSDYTSGNRVFTDGYHPNADAWTTSRTLALSGDVTGSVSLDGSANATLTTTVANDSHSHGYSTLGFNAGGNFGTTGSAGNFWISSHTTGQSDVPATYVDILNLSHASTHGIQIASGYSSNSGQLWIRTRSDNNAAPNGPGLQPWNYMWHSNNDGSGSGLDADLLDGVQGSSFLRSDANDTATGLITFSNASDAQITLDGAGTTWAGIKWNDVNGYDYIWYNGQNSTFAIGSGGANVAGKKLHVHGGLSVGSGVAATSTPANGIYSQGEIVAAGNTVYHSGNDGNLAKVVKGTVTGVNNSTYVTAFTVEGDNLSSSIRCTFNGTSSGVVVNAIVDLQVNHYQDILISSMGGFYTKLTIKVVSANNEDYAVEIKHNGGTTTSLAVEVFPLNSETVTFATSHSFTGTTLEHVCEYGLSHSATGGSNANIRTDGYIDASDGYKVAGTTRIDNAGVGSFSGLSSTGLATLSGGLSLSNTNIAFVNALSFADPGPGEGISWNGGNWSIWESPDDLTTNTGGNIQFVTSNSNRRMTVDTSGKLWTSHQGFVWGASNDGSGSGLDADLLDGQQGSYYASASSLSAYVAKAGDTMTGNLTISSANPLIKASATTTNWAGLELSAGGNQADYIFFKDDTAERARITVLDNNEMIFSQGSTPATKMKLNTSGDVEVTNTVFASGLSIDHSTSQAVNILAADSTADATFYAMSIDYNASGSDTLTGDRPHVGLYIDVDSSATGGDVSNEHRLYGIQADVRATGDSDLIYGGNFYAESQHSSGTVTSVVGLIGQGTADDTGTGHTAAVYGVQGLAYAYNTGSGGTSNLYALYGKTLLTSAADKNTNVACGVYGEVEVDTSGVSTTLSAAYAFQAVIDQDASDTTITNAYLFKGDYTGTFQGTRWGIYVDDVVDNYFGGYVRSATGFQIGSTSVIDSSRNLVNIGTISATSVGVTNIVTNKVVKFNGTILDDSNITDTGSAITLGSNTTVSGTLGANAVTITGSTSSENALQLTNGRGQLGHHTSGAGLWFDTA